MNPNLRDRIVRHIEPLSDERGYQVLDYIEFLESKYAGSTAPSPSLLTRFTEGIEDTLRAGKVSTTAIAETMGLLNKAMGVLGGVAAAGKSVASDFVGTTTRPTGAVESADAAKQPAEKPQSAPVSPGKADG
ncbi:MAG TPA: hypothetical protein VF981_10865 [Gemmatimonadaceae bacterium]